METRMYCTNPMTNKKKKGNASGQQLVQLMAEPSHSIPSHTNTHSHHHLQQFATHSSIPTQPQQPHYTYHGGQIEGASEYETTPQQQQQQQQSQKEREFENNKSDYIWELNIENITDFANINPGLAKKCNFGLEIHNGGSIGVGGGHNQQSANKYNYNYNYSNSKFTNSNQNMKNNKNNKNKNKNKNNKNKRIENENILQFKIDCDSVIVEMEELLDRPRYMDKVIVNKKEKLRKKLKEKYKEFEGSEIFEMRIEEEINKKVKEKEINWEEIEKYLKKNISYFGYAIEYPLHFAIEQGMLTLFRYLLDNHSDILDINMLNENSENVLHVLCKQRYIDNDILDEVLIRQVSLDHKNKVNINHLFYVCLSVCLLVCVTECVCVCL